MKRQIGRKVLGLVVGMAALVPLMVPAHGVAGTAAPNTINSAAIIDGEVKTADIAVGAVTGAKIATGAVTDSHITGPISASKIQDGVFQKKYANVIVVAKSGGDFTDPVLAVGSITNASSSNPYLVKITSGVYSIGSNRLVMKPYVDIEGSGEITTRITGSNGTNAIIV